MIAKFNKVHDEFKYNGVHFSFQTLKELGARLIKNGEEFEKEIGAFLLDWQDGNAYLLAKTSGSTGVPKTIRLEKQAMVNSAMATGQFFNLKPKDKALLCLPGSYIAGKMMLVRAMVLGLELDVVTPKNNLSFNEESIYDFAAMVPTQLQNNLNTLSHIKKLIVGGAQVSNSLVKAIQSLTTKIYETYGMTETVSHIAIKQINGVEEHSKVFKTLPNVSIKQNEKGCLVIDAPMVTSETIITNDIVRLENETAFEWIGRYDNIINSGGVKIVPEQVEEKLKDKINTRFFIASEEDEALGHRVVLIIEGKTKIKSEIFESLAPFEKPKKSYFINEFIETSSGKIQRKKTLGKLKK